MYTVAMKYGRVVIFGIILMCAIAMYAYASRHSTNDFAGIETTLQECLAGENSAVIDSCLKSNIASLLSQTSAASLMHYVVATTTPQKIVSQCHIIAHVIGEETLIDDGTLEGALARCSNECNYGCVHGAIAAEVARSFGETYPGEDIAHADTSEIEAVGKKYCEQSQALCHGIGHIARIASDSLLDALSICTHVSPEKYRYSCNNGVYMEDFGRIAFAPRPVTLEHPDDYGYPCNIVSDATGDCYYQLRDYQRARFDANNVPEKDRLGISKGVCAALQGKRRSDCFAGLGYKLDRGLDASGQLSHSGPSVCAALPSEDRVACMRGLAFNYASFSRSGEAVAYCDAQTVPSERSLCYDTVFENVTVAHDALSSICIAAGSAPCTQELDRYMQFR